MKLKDISLVFILSVVGLVVSVLSFLCKFFIENGAAYWVMGTFLLLWIIKFVIHFF